jgi:hypothetical protein
MPTTDEENHALSEPLQVVGHFEAVAYALAVLQ